MVIEHGTRVKAKTGPNKGRYGIALCVIGTKVWVGWWPEGQRPPKAKPK